MTGNSPAEANPYITLEEAKDQLSIDYGLTVHDQRILRNIGGAIDWAEKFTQRSLGELMELNSPTDSSAVPLPDPVDSPRGPPPVWVEPGDQPFAVGGEVVGMGGYTPEQYRRAWLNNPILRDDSASRRRDVKEAILLKVQILFDRNVAEMPTLQNAAESLLFPYRIGMGV
jgi:hypothetical protein